MLSEKQLPLIFKTKLCQKMPLNQFVPATIFVCSLLLMLVSVIGLFGRLHWRVDLINHTRPFLLIGCFVLMIIALAIGQPVGFALALIAALINGYIVIPYIAPNLKTGAADSQVTLMSANMLYRNRNPKRFLQVIWQIDPDILILQEVSSVNQTNGAELWEKYPFSLGKPNGGGQEIFIFSKIHIDCVEHRVVDKPWRSHVQVQLTIDQKQITILGVHPKAPMSPGRFGRRNAELDKLAAHVAAISEPVIVAGDMNITPWTPIFRNFLQLSGLSDGRKRFGFNFTWSPGSWPKSIPIDQVLYRGVNIHSFSSGPNTGSDHLPVIVEFSVD